MDETGLFFRCFPRGRCWAQPENRAGLEGLEGEGPMHGCRLLQHDRLAHGAAGRHQHGEKPLVFRHVRKSPILYYAKPSAWLDSSICERWFDEVFVPFVKRTTGRKVALVWDNCPGHIIRNNDPKITIIFLPPNVTSVYHPCDQGILHALKCQYKTEMVARLAQLIEDYWDTVRARSIRRYRYRPVLER